MLRILLLTFASLLICLLPVSAEPADPSLTLPDASASIATIIADHVTETTMTAMSPLLVISAQGAWEYYKADSSGRSTLPWYTSPWLWGSLLGLGLLFSLNTAIGNAVPLLKTPMNVVEEHENKITGLLIGLSMVLTRLFPDIEMPSSEQSAQAIQGTVNFGMAPIAAISTPWTATFIAIPIIVACYLLVWLTFHSLHVIALISPFGIVDTGLKFSRLGLLAVLFALWFISPLLSVVLCGAIILFSYFMAGWSFRLLIFGTLFSWDLLLFRHRRLNPNTTTMTSGFLCTPIDQAPLRSYGTISRDTNGTCYFHYRPWLCMPRKTIILPTDSLTIQRGILSPIVQTASTPNNSPCNCVRLRPKFRGHETIIAAQLGAHCIEETIVTRGFRQTIAWLRDLCQLRPPITTN